MIYIITLLIINTIVWYAFFYYLLYSIKHDINLAKAALILLVLFSLGFITCPLILFRIGEIKMMSEFVHKIKSLIGY